MVQFLVGGAGRARRRAAARDAAMSSSDTCRPPSATARATSSSARIFGARPSTSGPTRAAAPSAGSAPRCGIVAPCERAQNSHSLTRDTYDAIVSRSAGLKELTPRSSSCISSAIFTPVDGLKANRPVMPGRSSRTGMCGIGIST
jgi:hypothetical protein